MFKGIIKILLLCIIIIIIFSNCVNIKSKYTTPKFYTIQQAPLNNSIKTKIDKNIFIKQFSISGELETNRIITFDGNKLQYHNYHLWALSLDELLTEYTYNRFSSYNIFTKGVVTSIFSLSPDYILECKTNTFNIANSNQENSVDIVLTVHLYKYDKEIMDYQICYYNKYSKKDTITTFSLEKMTVIIGNIMSEIVDNILQDIIQNIISIK